MYKKYVKKDPFNIKQFVINRKTEFMNKIGVDKNASITVNFHKRRLTEDQDLFVRVGDFILHFKK